MVDEKSPGGSKLLGLCTKKLFGVTGSSLSGTSATFVRGQEFSLLLVSTMMVGRTSDVNPLLPRLIKMNRLAFSINCSHAPPKCGPYVGLNFQSVFFIKNSEAMR